MGRVQIATIVGSSFRNFATKSKKKTAPKKKPGLIFGSLRFGILNFRLESARVAFEDNLCLAIEVFRT
jgi:hypothetical protein